MYKLFLFILFLVIILSYGNNNNMSLYEGFNDRYNKLWYYPNCMETIFGGLRCYPYHYYPYRRSFSPLFPWTYYW